MGSGKPRQKPIAKTEWQLKAEPALEDSIAHWDRMARGKPEKDEWPSGLQCACCKKWPARSCLGCPVAIRTGAALCSEAPYYKAFNSYQIHGIGSAGFKADAVAMRDYLIETLRLVRLGEVKFDG